MLGHPAKHELMAYAEALVDGRTAIAVAMARHVAGCDACAAEVQAIRASLACLAHTPGLEPTRAFSAGLQAALSEQRLAVRGRGHSSALLTLAKAVTCIATLVVVAGASFGSASAPRAASVALLNAPRKTVVASLPSREEVWRTTAQIQTLAAAVTSPTRMPKTVQEDQQRRTVRILDADMSAAVTALGYNPGCSRASSILSANLRKQAQALKALYLERGL